MPFGKCLLCALCCFQCSIAEQPQRPSRSLCEFPTIAETYVLPELALSAIWDTLLPEELDIDWGILLGGFSDLWRSKNDPPGEF